MNLKAELTFQLFFWNEMMDQVWRTTSGEEVIFNSLGEWNFLDGPDFTGVSGEINGQHWHGDVEIHTKAHDWYLHQHHLDSAYDHVRIHVVYACSQKSKWPDIPTIVLKDQWQPHPERWNRKAYDMQIFELAAKETRWQNWCAQFDDFSSKMIAVSRAMGRHVQGDALEQWAMQIPWSFLPPHWTPVQVHAFFYIVAGHLDGLRGEDAFIQLLLSQEEVFHWASLYARGNIHWKKRVSMQSRSHLRIAQLAQLYLIIRENQNALGWWSPSFFSRALACLQVPEYWRHHYKLGQPMKATSSTELSPQAIESIVFNLSAFMFDQNVPSLKKNTTHD
jgi:hypothetical protein